MRSSLTGNKNTDYVILSKLGDRDLLSLCSVDQYTNELCQNENFWRSRTVNKYGNISKYRPINMSWRNFYLKVVRDLNSENGLQDLPNLIVVIIYPRIKIDIGTFGNEMIIQYCDDINIDKILVVGQEIRSQMINNYVYGGCAICRTELYKKGPACPNTCFLKNIEINDNDNTFKALTTCPIVKGECGHIYHTACISVWRRKRDICPLDNRQWISVEMDSFVTGTVENKTE